MLIGASNPPHWRTGFLRLPRLTQAAKRAAEAALAILVTSLARYAGRAASSSTFLACTGPELRPLAASSRSTNSITATGALSP